MVGAFKGVHGGWTFDNVRLLFHSPYWQYYRSSIQISLITALAGAAIGTAIAYSAIREGTPRWVRGILSTFSGVAARGASPSREALMEKEISWKESPG